MDPLSAIINYLTGKKVVDAVSQNETVRNTANDAKAGAEMLRQGIENAASDTTKFVGDTASKIGNKASKVLEDAKNAGKTAFNNALDGYFKMFGLGYKDGQVYSPEMEKYITDINNKIEKNGTDVETLKEIAEAAKPEEPKQPEEKESAEDVVTYTYKPGDTFGQVLLNLGLSDGTNLWGQGGDVDFYTQQLREQNALNSMGNIPIGTTIRLRRRK